LRNQQIVVIINKIDSGCGLEINNKLTEKYCELQVVEISALKELGINTLEDTIADKVFSGNVVASDDILISNVRHKNILHRVIRFLEDVLKGISTGVPLDIVSIDLRDAWEALGEITGSTVTEDIIDKIFTEFCIGK